MADKKLNIQNMIFKLEQFWSSKGCMIMPSYDVEKGAGTMSPYTFLRAVGPEPWAACYVEPSRRPADGRYGENLTGYSNTTNSKLLLSQLLRIFNNIT